ncbi:alpha-galactosidase [Paracoccus aestuarii]|uniref:alpha-galactosidase n=1 Tax=Paracoccus aestuarii TaxID=453842 RepID=A0A418ZWX1_9RHOB|nr:alpha-galactosidase [Paracoccus aestuarii]RJL05014.1 alpha-galactosidase [Paracoccus aestuarii]WCR01207.1 alpha-galactosidase [Paracoccus aestuarii]
MSLWRIDSPAQTLVFGSDGGMSACHYWGEPLPADTDLDALVAAGAGGVTGGMLDALPPLSLLPEARRSFPGQPGLVAFQDDRPLLPEWRLAGADQDDGGLVLRHVAPGLRLDHHIATRAHGLITIEAVLRADRPLVLHHLAVALPAPLHMTRLTELAGRWTREFQPVTATLDHGTRLRDARTGRSGHEHPPLFWLTTPGTSHTTGEVAALHLAWSGGHRMLVETLPEGRRQIQLGPASGSEPEPGTEFRTAPLWLIRGEAGLNSAAIPLQRRIRDALPPSRQPRPVHYNGWEAVYFRHDQTELARIADRAATLGAERFVLDDGWFGRRDDDTTSLGDWTVDPRKHPKGLGPLIARLRAMGLRFGLWLEPEMVNEDSDLFRAHPDWMLGPRDQIRGRNQLHLDLSRPEVRDHLFDHIDRILTDHDIDYVKWDHNRLTPMADARQTRGLYALLDRLRAAHPGVEWESCASGGGRIDGAILTRCGRVWLSDSNDAIERLRIQHEAAMLLPACVTGSHVGPRDCHTSGRVLPMALRAWTAAQRHMGFEMDPRELTDDEARILARVTAWWRENRHWMMAGDIWRLDRPAGSLAEMQLAADGARMVVFAAQIEAPVALQPPPLRLTGLDPRAVYRLRMLERPRGHPASRTALTQGPVTLTGAALMAQGVALPPAFPQTIAVIEGTRL